MITQVLNTVNIMKDVYNVKPLAHSIVEHACLTLYALMNSSFLFVKNKCGMVHYVY